MLTRFLIGSAAAIAAASPAAAGELITGLYVHDVDTVLTKSGVEGGSDVMLGWRFERLGSTRLQPYIIGAVNTAGETNYAAVGLSARFGDRFYVRPGLGLAVHNGSKSRFEIPNDKIEFGSRILFEPEIAVGTQLTERLSVEASWVHMSHAQLFGRQNPGIDNFGVRLNIAFP